jgi:hypothetical protein
MLLHGSQLTLLLLLLLLGHHLLLHEHHLLLLWPRLLDSNYLLRHGLLLVRLLLLFKRRHLLNLQPLQWCPGCHVLGQPPLRLLLLLHGHQLLRLRLLC